MFYITLFIIKQSLNETLFCLNRKTNAYVAVKVIKNVEKYRFVCDLFIRVSYTYFC